MNAPIGIAGNCKRKAFLGSASNSIPSTGYFGLEKWARLDHLAADVRE